MSAPTLRAARRRAGNRAYTGNSGADTWRCTDGWLSTAANTPAQFRVLAQALDLGRLCEDDGLLDVAAFRPSNWWPTTWHVGLQRTAQALISRRL